MSDPHATVLLVEDDPHVERLMRRVLEGAGYALASVTHADAAPAALGDATRVAIVDLHIEPAGAVAAARALRSRRPDVALVFVSGAPPSAADEAYLAEAGGVFLAKPFAPAQLRDAVTAAHGAG